jgi:FixJ family two-component response regulator
LTPPAPAQFQHPERVVTVSKLVSLVDDDESVRESLPDLLRSFGLEVTAFASAEAFLESDSLVRAACLILDVAMPGMTGPELQQELVRRKHEIPIIFITAHSDDRMRPNALRRGAVAYLFKPFSEAVLLQAVNAALGSAGA